MCSGEWVVDWMEVDLERQTTGTYVVKDAGNCNYDVKMLDGPLEGTHVWFNEWTAGGGSKVRQTEESFWRLAHERLGEEAQVELQLLYYGPEEYTERKAREAARAEQMRVWEEERAAARTLDHPFSRRRRFAALQRELVESATD